MQYLDNKHQKIGEGTEFQVEKLSADGELTKVKKEKMTSFKLYTGKSSKAKKKKKQFEPTQKYIKPVKKGMQLTGVSLTDKMVFLDNLATMLKAGLALAPTLKTLKNEIKNKYFQKIIEYLQQHVENGQLLSKGMKHYPKVFSEMIIATMEVGENTGMLADSAGHLADILRAQKRLRGKVIGALMYPSIVLLALIGVSLFLALTIFPQLIGMFRQADVELPFVLVAVNFINHFLRANGYYVIAGLIGLGIGLKYLFRLPKPRFALHVLMLKLPFVGKIIKELSLTRFAGNLTALLAAGLSIVKSLEIVSQTVSNLKYRNEIIKMAGELEKGVSLEKSMKQRPDLFPSLAVQLCKVGETTGELENILKKIARFYEDRVNNVLSNLSTIIEPILLVLVGIAVGFIAVSVIGPMYELTNSFAD
ncbi:type II secretion system F family protein [Candidatus Parcubacteria bacterium]|jgi:type IV pilus assembly protein PilC|nr:type II secretion system F family protein [Candidatus Parcubacteria bacterium]MBT7228126.1 type II secretion system F family protein [Candidatus Parcubacteria bacterium]